MLINPPYAAATNRTQHSSRWKNADNKVGVSQEQNLRHLPWMTMAEPARELFTRTVCSAHCKEIPNATLAMFSTLKYINAPALTKFREAWKLICRGFAVHNQAFDGLTGKFPMAF